MQRMRKMHGVGVMRHGTYKKVKGSDMVTNADEPRLNV